MRPTVGLFGFLDRVNTVRAENFMHARRYVHVTFGHQGIQAAWRKRNIRPLNVKTLHIFFIPHSRLPVRRSSCQNEEEVVEEEEDGDYDDFFILDISNWTLSRNVGNQVISDAV